MELTEPRKDRVMMTILPRLEVSSGPRFVATDEQLDDAGRALGFPLPPSYRAFAREYGAGRLADLFLIVVPGGTPGCNDLVAHSRALADSIRESLARGFVRFSPDGSAELVARLVPFGTSENGDTLCWDPGLATPEGELPVYVIGARRDATRRAAHAFAEFVRKVLEPGMGGILGRSDGVLPPRFDPMPNRM